MTVVKRYHAIGDARGRRSFRLEKLTCDQRGSQVHRFEEAIGWAKIVNYCRGSEKTLKSRVPQIRFP